MTRADVERIRENMDRAQARTLQPHFTRPFFLDAFRLLGGSTREREPGRFEISNVPAELRHNDSTTPLLRRYERVTFDRSLVTVPRHPPAEFLAPGHPLLDATIDLILERFDGLLRQGAVLVDDRGQSEEPETGNWTGQGTAGRYPNASISSTWRETPTTVRLDGRRTWICGQLLPTSCTACGGWSRNGRASRNPSSDTVSSWPGST